MRNLLIHKLVFNENLGINRMPLGNWYYSNNSENKARLDFDNLG